MHPILFEAGSFTVYTYGFCLAIGAILGLFYMVREGNRQLGLTFDHANTLFLLLVAGGILGGKLFFILGNVSRYASNPKLMVSEGGFVFYGSLLCCVPVMLWFFRKHKIPAWPMLDVMAVTISILHVCGRIGCFMAGCDYGLPTDSIAGVIFTHPACQASPLNTPLHPTQLYEAGWVLLILILLVILKNRRSFPGQLFLTYLIAYGIGRFVIEFFRGDQVRGFIPGTLLSTSQFISMIIVVLATYFYVRRRNSNLRHP